MFNVNRTGLRSSRDMSHSFSSPDFDRYYMRALGLCASEHQCLMLMATGVVYFARKPQLANDA